MGEINENLFHCSVTLKCTSLGQFRSQNPLSLSLTKLLTNCRNILFPRDWRRQGLGLGCVLVFLRYYLYKIVETYNEHSLSSSSSSIKRPDVYERSNSKFDLAN